MPSDLRPARASLPLGARGSSPSPHAFQEFLQGVFIARRVYPIAYNKWLREQVEGWLGQPDLYPELPSILEVRRLEGPEVVEKGERLRRLLDRWTVERLP